MTIKGRPTIILFKHPSIKKSAVYFEAYTGEWWCNDTVKTFREWIDITKLNRCQVFDNLLHPDHWGYIKTMAKQVDEDRKFDGEY